MQDYFLLLLWKSIQELPTAFGATWSSLLLLSTPPIIVWIVRRRTDSGSWRGIVTFPDGWPKTIKDVSLSLGIWVALLLIVLAYNFVSLASKRDEEQRKVMATQQMEVNYGKQPSVKEEESRQTMADLRQQLNSKDIEMQELKRLRDRADDAEKRAASGYTALRHSLEDKEKVIRDLQSKTDEKIIRSDLRGKFLVYLQSTQIIKRNCLSGLEDYFPKKEFERWEEQTLRELRDLGDGSYMFRLVATPPPNARSHYQVDGKPVSEECNQVAKVIDIKQAVLKDFIAELSK